MPTMRMILLWQFPAGLHHTGLHLFVKEKKKKKKWLNDVSLEKISCNINVLCWVLTQKHKQTWFFGEKNKGQTDSLLPVYTYLKMPCKWQIKH